MSIFARFKVWQVWASLLMALLSPLVMFFFSVVAMDYLPDSEVSLSPLGWLISWKYWLYTTLGALPALLLGLWARSKGTKLGLYFALLSYPWIFLWLFVPLALGFSGLVIIDFAS